MAKPKPTSEPKQPGEPDAPSAPDGESSTYGQGLTDEILQSLKARNPGLSEERVRKMIEDSGF